jgi:hypothetical protein
MFSKLRLDTPSDGIFGVNRRDAVADYRTERT